MAGARSGHFRFLWNNVRRWPTSLALSESRQCPPPFPRLRPPPFQTCPRSQAFASPPPPPASVTRIAPTYCWLCWHTHRRRRRFQHVEVPVCTSRVVPRTSQARQRARPVVNCGNANAFTGKTGRTAEVHGEDRRKGDRLQPAVIFLASTGVIGEPLNASRSTADGRPRRAAQAGALA